MLTLAIVAAPLSLTFSWLDILDRIGGWVLALAARRIDRPAPLADAQPGEDGELPVVAETERPARRRKGGKDKDEAAERIEPLFGTPVFEELPAGKDGKRKRKAPSRRAAECQSH